MTVIIGSAERTLPNFGIDRSIIGFSTDSGSSVTFASLHMPGSRRACDNAGPHAACQQVSPCAWAPLTIRSKRRINTKPTPRLGGLAIFAGLFVACALQIFGTLNWGWPSALIPHPSMEINYPLLGLAFLVVFASGAADHIFQLTPKTRSSRARSSPP